MLAFSKYLQKKEVWKDVINSISDNESLTGIYGVEKAQTSIILQTITTDKAIIYVSDNDFTAKNVWEQLRRENVEATYLPSRQFVFYHVDAYSHDLMYLRIESLHKIWNKKAKIICTSIDNFYDKLPEANWFFDQKLEISIGESIERQYLLERLYKLGYERVSMVEAKGQFSLRGSILDCFPISSNVPTRIEFFDDEVDSIREFSIDNQRSLEMKENVVLLPANEMYIENSKEIIEKLDNDYSVCYKKNKNKEEIVNGLSKYKEILEQLEENSKINNPMLLIPYNKRYNSNLFEYMPKEKIIVFDDPDRVYQRLENKHTENIERFKNLFETGEVLIEHQYMFINQVVVEDKIRKESKLFLMPFLKPIRDMSYKYLYDFKWQEITKYSGKLDWFANDIKEKIRNGYCVAVALSQEEKINHFVDEMAKLDVLVSKENDILGAGLISCYKASLEKGFEWRNEKFMLFTDNELFSSNATRKMKKKRGKGIQINSFSDLKINDYVVHEKHGVGKYVGITQLKVEDIRKDYLTIEYDKSDRLFIPVNQMDLIQKYIGADQGKPKLNKLGGQEWEKTKYNAKKAIEVMAEDLIELYAKREAIKGYGFSEDSIWQKEFEDAFPHEETFDQLRSVEEIKKDMEKLRPMDRLLCGDVGFGKTEVALRAVFKAVQDSKQVAVLVPTTILAQQHYTTITKRFSDFPIKVQMLSRFRTKSQQKEIIKAVGDGRIDIIIGTHRLLSEDLLFKDLGLLIVDEEQRFGVKHKERLKKIKENVDVLTLTATPIPRTLHMSMVGIRDLSVIEEPPLERHPVQTFVVEYNEHLIRDAVLKELSRGGQIFYVFNRVRGIQRIASILERLVPEARIAVAHGQMGERGLENIMIDFMNHEYDVLVCTTIIETGLDISNVNTMMIHNADQLGLSQLYQLRGRVGRSNRLAFAYLMYEKDKILTEIAQKRLKAIKEFTEFGSGFKIAMRDLEIRGAGNLLGAAQHGHMMAIGYDLYVKYLEASVSKFKTGEDLTVIETVVDIMVDAYIPKFYIEDEQQRIDVYKRIASISSSEDKSEVIDELIDRYGDVPKACEQLIKVAEIKKQAQKIGVEEVKQDKECIILKFKNEAFLQLPVIEMLMKKYPMRISFDFSKQYILNYYMPKREIHNVLNQTEELLKTLVSFHFPDYQL
jgi:transcription-repair coupling factor (superfamily II helicase)